MTLADRFNTVACLAVAAAVMCYCLAEPAPLLALFSAPILVIGWRIGRAQRPWVLPRAAASGLVLLSITWAASQVLRSQGPLISHLSQFLVLVQLIKLFDRRTPRDDAQLLSLSLFIIIGAILTDNSLPVGLLLLIYSPLATAAAMLLQIRSGALRLDDARHRACHGLAPRQAVPSLRPDSAAGRHLAGVAALSVILSSSLAVVGFLATPRGFAQGALGQFGNFAQPIIGFTDQVRLGKAGLLSEDSTPVMDVLLTDSEGRPAGSDSMPLYLRGSALNRYDRATGAWTTDRAEIPGDARPRGSHTILTGAHGDRTFGQHISVRATLPGYFFSMWAPIELDAPQSEVPLTLPTDLTLRNRGAGPRAGARTSYTVWSSPEARLAARPAPIPDTFRQGPIYDLAVRILDAKRIALSPAARTPADNRAAASAIQSYLRSNCRYTREMIAPDAGVDPIEMFLFTTKAGHCEYFASAMVALAQSVGLDARVVTGFLAAEFNPVTGQYIVRQSSAHAWAEVSLGDGRWHTVDPSPSSEIDRFRLQSAGLLGRLRQWYDAVDFAWNRSVISFDERRRIDLLGAMSRRSISPSRLIAAVERFGRALFGNPLAGPLHAVKPGLLWLILAAVATAVIALASRLVRRRLHRRRATRALTAADPALRQLLADADFYPRVLEALESRGRAKPLFRPPLAHSRSLAAADPALAALVAQASHLFYQVRFARRPLSPEQSIAARKLPADVTALLSRAP